MANEYCQVGDVKASRLWPSGVTPDTVDDAVLAVMITSASRQVDGVCGRFFYSQATTTRYFRPEYEDQILVPDLVSVTSIQTDENGDGTFDATWLTTDYDLYPYNNGVDGWPYWAINATINGQYRFRGGYKSVMVTGTWGWAAVPDKVKEATIRQTIALYREQFGIALPTPEGQTNKVLSTNELTPDAQGLVSEYIHYI